MKNFVLIADLAQEFGIDRSNCHKYVKDICKKYGIILAKQRIGGKSGNQPCNVLSLEDADLVRKIRAENFSINQQKPSPTNVEDGEFYAVYLGIFEGRHRIKLGFGVSAKVRFSECRRWCPDAQLLKTWPCRRSWEKTALDALEILGERVGEEVFHFDSIDPILSRVDSFFEFFSPYRAARKESRDLG